jgi:hypothetical protein
MSLLSLSRVAAVGFVILMLPGLAAGAETAQPAPVQATTIEMQSVPAAPAKSQQEAMAALMEVGGVLMHSDDRRPGRPIIAVEFPARAEFKEEWLKHLAAFPHLQTLGLGGTSLSDAGVAHLLPLAELDTLVLAGTKITDAGIVRLKTLKRLRQLVVSGTAVTAAGAAELRKSLPGLEVSFDEPAGDAVTKPNAGPSAADKAAAETFSAVKIKALRQEAANAAKLPEDTPQGWSKSRVDPGKLVEVFQPLRLRKGYALRAYQFREGGNGNGFVWAMPADAEFPEPKDCSILESHLLKAPKPSEALDDAMEAIEGDGSPWSYLAASLLRRQFSEFGAMWHGSKWSLHAVLDADPRQAVASREDDSPLDRPTTKPDEWNWLEPAPQVWGPRVRVEKDRVTVTFHTYCGLEKESLYRHVDTYRPGKLRAKTEEKRIAIGRGGFMP